MISQYSGKYKMETAGEVAKADVIDLEMLRRQALRVALETGRCFLIATSVLARLRLEPVLQVVSAAVSKTTATTQWTTVLCLFLL